ncbi:hypothetical protein N3K66_004992 [Trichothecium roseum]|uniref:Uncharacterized protein n=1 Tax=Trichothecium roseum TaxID=47278 RepID=A0ACC0V2T2_9HYPO|nr:hypothetical protein N3K66_004992 [Trichothecium roseum]
MLVARRRAAALTGYALRRTAPSRLAQQDFVRGIASVRSLASSDGEVSLKKFKALAWEPEKPILLKEEESPGEPPEDIRKWFTRADPEPESSTGSGHSSVPWTLSSRLDDLLNWPFPFELVTPAQCDGAPPVVLFRQWMKNLGDPTDAMLSELFTMSNPDIGKDDYSLIYGTFSQLYAPLRLLKRALEFNLTLPAGAAQLQLYIAQSPIDDLPEDLKDDLRKPFIVRNAGRGDVYSSSIWLGTEPTFTPLHRDPNPNLFSQICNHKVVRMLPPDAGEQLFHDVQRRIQQSGNSRIRGPNMMQGREREELHDDVWVREVGSGELQEAEVAPGDALYIPKGWWHSIKSKGTTGYLNASANWWFR